MIRVAIINHGFPRGGISKITQNIADYARACSDRIEIRVYTSLRRELPPDGFPAVVFTTDPCRTAIEEKVDILVECSRAEKGIGKVLAAGIKVVYAEHGMPFHEQWGILERRQGGHRKPFFKRLLWHLVFRRQFEGTDKALRMAMARTKRTIEQVDAFVVLCDSYKKETEAALNLPATDKIRVIFNPAPVVDNPDFEKEKVILYCGRLSHYDKRPDRLLRIWKKVQDRLPGYRLEIIGDGHERPSLEAQAENLRLQRCSFLGYQSDTDPFYRKADILCLVSQMEGWPVCLTEAQAHGVIPVSFDCSGGVREILTGGNGVMVPCFDEDAFAEALVKTALMDGKTDLRKRLVSEARRHTPEENGKAWLDLFNSLVPHPEDAGRQQSCPDPEAPSSPRKNG